MSRKLQNWLKGYQEYTEESEAPDSFHLWAGLSILASAVRRNVWLHQGIYILYPNIFVILVAPPGKVGKSTVIRMGRKILRGVEGIMMGPDSVTREEFIRFMATVHDGQQSALTVHSSEFSSLIEPSGIKMFQFLTDIYDCDYDNPTGWKYATKGSGRDTIQDPVVNLLAGTTPSWIAEGFPESVLSHGFTSRTIFVYEEVPRFDNPFPKKANSLLVNDLTRDLQEISLIMGEFSWGQGTKDEYAAMYKKIMHSAPDDHRVEGYHNRKRIHVLKVAMLLSLAEKDDLVLEVRDLKAAMRILELVEESMPKTFSAVGKYSYTSDLERVLAQIRKGGGMTLQDVLQKNYHVGPEEVEKIIAALRKAGWITFAKEEDGDWWCRPAKA